MRDRAEDGEGEREIGRVEGGGQREGGRDRECEGWGEREREDRGRERWGGREG